MDSTDAYPWPWHRQPATPREMLASLREYEGVACFWPVLVGLVRTSLLLIVIPALGALASIYIGANRASLPRVVVGVVLAVVLARVGFALASRKPWWGPLADRLWSYEEPVGADATLPVRVRGTDQQRAARAMRRAKLAVGSTVGRSDPPPDAPALDAQLWVFRPRAWQPHDGASLQEQAARILDRAGIEARVAGLDVDGRSMTANT